MSCYTVRVIESYFTTQGDALAPRPEARGPWAEDMLHGRFLGGIAARAIEADWVEPGWRVARLTVDLFRPAALKPVSVRTEPVREGRKVRIVDAYLDCDGHNVGRVTAELLTEGDEPPGSIWRPEPQPWPDPESLPAPEEPNEAEVNGWLFRQVAGGFNTGDQSRVWTNDTVALVEGEAMSALVRAAVSGDIACPLANSSDQGLFYINADYTMYLARYPVGAWIGVEVSQQQHSGGISLGSANLVDRAGIFATSTGASISRPPLEH